MAWPVETGDSPLTPRSLHRILPVPTTTGFASTVVTASGSRGQGASTSPTTVPYMSLSG